MANWSLTHTISGVDRSSSAFSRTTSRRARNAQAIASFSFRPPAGAVDLPGLVGQAVTIDANWNSAPAVRRFTGVVDGARWVGDGLIELTCVDGLKEAMRGRTTAQVLALMPGARWHEQCFGPESDGWEQFREIATTLDYSYFKDASGADQWVSRKCKSTPDLELSAAQVLEGSVNVIPYQRSDLINRVALTVQARGVILHHWELACSWSAYPAAGGFCPSANPSWFSTNWWLPSPDQINGAIQKAGWKVQQGSGLATAFGSGGGVHFQGLPKSGPSTTVCGTASIDWVWRNWQGDPSDPDWPLGDDRRMTHANWRMVCDWEQTGRRNYDITVEAPDGVALHGELKRTERAGYDEGEEDRGWSDSPSTVTPSGGNWALAEGTHYQSVEIDQAEADAVLECAVSVVAADIYGRYRGTKIELELLSIADAFDLQIGDTVRIVGVVVDGVTTTARGTVEEMEEYWDPESGDAGMRIVLGNSQCSGAGGTDDAIAAPTPPSLDPPYTLDQSMALTTHIGGFLSSPALDPDWRGWVTNLKIPEGGGAPQIYDPMQFAVEYPKRPTAAKETLTATGAATYRVYPPNDELTQVVS